MKKISVIATIFSAVIFIAGCKKDDGITTAPLEVHFSGSAATYYVENSASSVYNIPVSLTALSNTDVSVSVSVTSPTNAIDGQQYTLASNTISIPAGQGIGNVQVKGIFAGYAGNRVDTLKFKISSSSVNASVFDTTYTLVLKKYCPVSITDLSGVYANSNDVEPDPWGPYNTSIVNANAYTGVTSDTIRIDNFFDYGGYVLVKLDYSDPSNFKATVLDGQNTLGLVHPTYGTILVRSGGQTGSFSACDQTFDIKFNLYVSAGSFGNYRTTIAR